MSEKLVSLVSDLFKIDTVVLNEALNDEAKFNDLSTQIKSHKVFNDSEYDSLMKNSIANASELLVKKWSENGNDVPSAIYNKVKGTTLEMKEKTLLKENPDFKEPYEDYDDLVRKIIVWKSNKPDSQDEINKYIKLNENLQNEFETKLTEVQNEKNSYIVNDQITKAIDSLNYNYDDTKLPEVKKTVLNDFNSKFTFQLKDGKVIVLKEGNVLTDKVGNPLPVNEVLRSNLPTFIELKDATGGRGDQTKPKSTGKYDLDSFNEAVKGKTPTEQTAIYIEYKKHNPDFKLK